MGWAGGGGRAGGAERAEVRQEAWAPPVDAEAASQGVSGHWREAKSASWTSRGVHSHGERNVRARGRGDVCLFILPPRPPRKLEYLGRGLEKGAPGPEPVDTEAVGKALCLWLRTSGTKDVGEGLKEESFEPGDQA